MVNHPPLPKDLANPIFACTGMSFWIYLATVILSLPKVIVFVALGTPSSEHSKGAKAGKVVAIGVVVVITCKSTVSLPVCLSVCLGIYPGRDRGEAVHAENFPSHGLVLTLLFLLSAIVFATRWIRKRMAVATKEIEAERAASSSGTVQGDLERGSRPEQDLK